MQAFVEEIGAQHQGQYPHKPFRLVLKPALQLGDRFPNAAAAHQPGQGGQQQQGAGHQGEEPRHLGIGLEARLVEQQQARLL